MQEVTVPRRGSLSCVDRLHVKLFVFPPNSRKPSGHVELLQRTFKGELYTQPLPSRIPELQQECNAYPDYRDTRLPQQTQPPATNKTSALPERSGSLGVPGRVLGGMWDGAKREREVRVKDEIRCRGASPPRVGVSAVDLCSGQLQALAKAPLARLAWISLGG